MKSVSARAAASKSGRSARLRHFLLRMANQASTKESQEAWVGSQWKTKGRQGRYASQTATSAERCRLTGSRTRWMVWPNGVCRSSRSRSSQNSRERCWRRTIAGTCPSRTANAASRSAVPLRTYSNSRRAGRPGATGWLGAAGRRTPMPVFSSTQKVGPSSGGCSSSSMIATALRTKSGSRSSIQESKPLQADLGRLEDLPHRALARAADAQLGMVAQVPRQVAHRPVRLARPAHLGRRLTRHHQDPRLALGAVLAGRRAMRTVFQSGQPGGGEPVPPLLRRVPRDPQLLGDVDVAGALGRPQHDPGTLRGLLAARPRPHPALQFLPFLDRQHDRRRSPTHLVAPCPARPRAPQEAYDAPPLTVETQQDRPLD